MSYKYILGGPDGYTPVPVDDLFEWDCWMESHRSDCVVRQEHIGPYFVSTLFLGLDMDIENFFADTGRPPILFETMSFLKAGKETKILAQERCSTWAEAEEQHKRIADSVHVSVNG